MRRKLDPVVVLALSVVWLSLGCFKGPDRDTPESSSNQIHPDGEGAGGANAGGTPDTPLLRQTSPNVTLLEPGVLSSPSLPALGAGGYYRILTFDSANETGFTFTAANSTGYGLFAASSPKLVEGDDGREALDPSTTLNPVFLDGSRTAGAYNGTNKYLVLRANGRGEPVFLSGYSRSALPAALLTVADGQTVTVPADEIREGNDVLWLTYEVGDGMHFVLVPATSSDPKLTVSDATLTEGNGGTADATFTVSLSAAATSTVTVKYATVGGTATAANGTLTFLPGETRKTVTVAVNGGAARERDVDFFLTLASPTNAVIVDGVGLGSIRTRTGSRPSRPTTPPSK